MTRVIPPVRGDELTPKGKATIRFSKYLESLASAANTSSPTDELIGSYFPSGASLGELSKRIDSLENSIPIAFNGFIEELLKDGRTQDSLIAELLSGNQTAIAFISELQAATEIIDVSVTTTYTQTKFDNGIFCDATSADFTVTMIDPALAFKKRVYVKNETGAVSAITLAATVGTVEVTTLNNQEFVILAPRPDLATPANSVWASVG